MMNLLQTSADLAGDALTENIDIELLMCILNFSEALYLCVTLSSSSDLIFSSEVSERVCAITNVKDI